MRICIICREEKSEDLFNREHVIPEAINGYLIINSVCTICNSNLSQIDDLLINHKFIEFQRQLLGIKGKSGKIPNPLANEKSTLKDDPEQEVKLIIDENGHYKPIIIPRYSYNINDGIVDSFEIRIDLSEESKIDEIIDKICRRKGIDKSVITSKTYYEESKPYVHTRLTIDLHNYKLGLLKIAYEFAVTNIPDYFYDSKAELISKLLFTRNKDDFEKVIQIIGDGFTNDVLEPYSHLIDFENDNHYIILFNCHIGLLCFINLFKTFNICFVLSEKSDYIKNNLIVGKNDTINRKFKYYDANSLLNATYGELSINFLFAFENQELAEEYLISQELSEFKYFRENDKIPVFDKNGNLISTDIELVMLSSPRMGLGDIKNSFIDEYSLEHIEVYIKEEPTQKLYRVIRAKIERYRIGKI